MLLYILNQSLFRALNLQFSLWTPSHVPTYSKPSYKFLPFILSQQTPPSYRWVFLPFSPHVPGSFVKSQLLFWVNSYLPSPGCWRIHSCWKAAHLLSSSGLSEFLPTIMREGSSLVSFSSVRPPERWKEGSKSGKRFVTYLSAQLSALLLTAHEWVQM